MEFGGAVKNVILPGLAPGLNQAGFREGSEPLPPQPQQAGQNATQAEKPDLAITQLQDLRKHAAPAAGRQKRKQALDHQDQGHGQPEGAAVHALFFRAGRCALPTEHLEEFRG